MLSVQIHVPLISHPFMQAHALVALSATASAGSLARGARELVTPLLSLSGVATSDGAAATEELHGALQVRSGE